MATQIGSTGTSKEGVGTEIGPSPMARWQVVGLRLLRLDLGFLFFWAFIDKVFGLGYSTSVAKDWLNGGSPTKGFLGGVNVGPRPPARMGGGQPTGSTNPIIDEHILEAFGFLVLIAFLSKDQGLVGRWWANLPLVKKHPWLM